MLSFAATVRSLVTNVIDTQRIYDPTTRGAYILSVMKYLVRKLGGIQASRAAMISCMADARHDNDLKKLYSYANDTTSTRMYIIDSMVLAFMILLKSDLCDGQSKIL